MADNKIDLRIITPRGVKFIEQADTIIMRCLDGDMGVLTGHEPVSIVLGDGILRIIDDNTVQKIAVFGGVAIIQSPTVTILTSIAQRPEEIDLFRAETDRKQAEQLLQEKSDEVRVQSSQVMLRRALVRIEVSVYPQQDDDEDDPETD